MGGYDSDLGQKKIEKKEAPIKRQLLLSDIGIKSPNHKSFSKSKKEYKKRKKAKRKAEREKVSFVENNLRVLPKDDLFNRIKVIGF
jgi:hypothetical protein